MSEGKYWKGIQRYVEPEGEMKYNFFIPVKSILEETGLTFDDLGIFFFRNINKDFKPKMEIEGEYLWLLN